MKRFSIETSPSLSINDIAHYKDTPYTLLFICQLLAILAFTFSFGLEALSSTPPDKIEIEEDGDKNKEKFDNLSIHLVGGLFLIVGIGCLLSIAWVQMTAVMASKIVIFSLGAVVVVNIFSGVALFAFDQVVGACSLLLFAALSVAFFFYVRDRLEFVAANLKVACRAVLTMPAVILWALVVLIIQVVWCILWFIAAYGVATNESITSISKNGETYDLSECTSYTYYDDVDIGGIFLQCAHNSCSVCVCDSSIVRYSSCFSPRINYWKYFALFLSLYWTSAVLSNIVHCTTAGAVTSWWFNGTPLSASNSSQIVKNCIVHSCTALLGPICCGSLLVAIIRSLRSMVHIWLRAMEVSENSSSFTSGGYGSSSSSSTTSKLTKFLTSCLETALRVLDELVTYCNHYAFCYVSAYDMSFMEASRSVVNLFLTKGFTTLVNDNLLDNVLTMGHLVVGVICMLVGYGYAILSGFGKSSSYAFILAMSGFFIGYAMCMLTLNVISSATATVYVCFTENPASLQTHHPEYFEELMSKWRKFYPEANLSLGSMDGHEYSPPSAPARAPGGAVGGGRKGAVAGGGYFALPTAAQDDDDEEVSLHDSGEGSSILQGDQLTGKSAGSGSTSQVGDGSDEEGGDGGFHVMV